MLKNKFGASTKKKWLPYLLPVLIFGLVLASGLFLVLPRIKEINNTRRDLKQEKERLTQLTSKVAFLQGLDQVGLSDQVDLISKAFPSEKNVPLLLSVFKNIANQNSLKILELEIAPGNLASSSAKENTVGKEEGPASLSFKIILEGNFDDFKKFLAQIEKTAPLIDLKEAEIAGENIDGTLKISLDLNSPYMFLPTSLDLVEKTLPQINSQEEEIYQNLKELNFSLNEQKIPSVPTGKENPFSL